MTERCEQHEKERLLLNRSFDSLAKDLHDMTLGYIGVIDFLT